MDTHRLYIVNYRTDSGQVWGMTIKANSRQHVIALMQARGVYQPMIISIDEVTDE